MWYPASFVIEQDDAVVPLVMLLGERAHDERFPVVVGALCNQSVWPTSRGLPRIVPLADEEWPRMVVIVGSQRDFVWVVETLVGVAVIGNVCRDRAWRHRLVNTIGSRLGAPATLLDVSRRVADGGCQAAASLARAVSFGPPDYRTTAADTLQSRLLQDRTCYSLQSTRTSPRTALVITARICDVARRVTLSVSRTFAENLVMQANGDPSLVDELAETARFVRPTAASSPPVAVTSPAFNATRRLPVTPRAQAAAARRAAAREAAAREAAAAEEASLAASRVINWGSRSQWTAPDAAGTVQHYTIGEMDNESLYAAVAWCIENRTALQQLYAPNYRTTAIPSRVGGLWLREQTLFRGMLRETAVRGFTYGDAVLNYLQDYIVGDGVFEAMGGFQPTRSPSWRNPEDSTPADIVRTLAELPRNTPPTDGVSPHGRKIHL